MIVDVAAIPFTSPIGRGRRAASAFTRVLTRYQRVGSGLRSIDSLKPLTPTLSLWERGLTPLTLPLRIHTTIALGLTPMNDASSTIIWHGMKRAQLDAAYDNQRRGPRRGARAATPGSRAAPRLQKEGPELLDLPLWPAPSQSRVDLFRCGRGKREPAVPPSSTVGTGGAIARKSFPACRKSRLAHRLRLRGDRLLWLAPGRGVDRARG